MEIIEVKIDDLKFAEYNPREMPEHEYESLKQSIKEFGFVEPVVANKKDNTIIGGHMRVRAAKDIGITTVPVAYVDLDETRAKILNLALNRITGRWDIGKLEGMIYGLTQIPEANLELTGFEDWELKLYNPGEESSLRELENIQGETPNDTLSIVVTFSDQEKYEAVAKWFSGGKVIKETDGEKLWNLINQQDQQN
jgi:hypothetical protein